MNKDELRGKKKQVEGEIKQRIGRATDDERLHDEGVADEMKGDVQDTLGRGRRKVGETLEDLGDDLKR